MIDGGLFMIFNKMRGAAVLWREPTVMNTKSETKQNEAGRHWLRAVPGAEIERPTEGRNNVKTSTAI